MSHSTYQTYQPCYQTHYPTPYYPPQPKRKNVQTIVIIRHGEKPPDPEIGQLDCQGLNRSLMLPDYFRKNFPKADFLFAPNPSVRHHDQYYIRPLSTINPTSISLGLPVNLEFGYETKDDYPGFGGPKDLVDELVKPKYHDKVIYIAWEHKKIIHKGKGIAQMIFDQFSGQLNKSKIPEWSKHDFDSVFVFDIDWNKTTRPGGGELNFRVTQQGLNSLSQQCPKICQPTNHHNYCHHRNQCQGRCRCRKCVQSKEKTEPETETEPGTEPGTETSQNGNVNGNDTMF